MSTAVSSAAAQARAVIDDQERRLLDSLTTARNEKMRELDQHIAACDLQVRVLYLLLQSAVEV